jgi:RHH-type proline utilization regulon transcriptional repressor/proline dehydrogenase/delta 1-pyrroline-5-carboxylate dehydrogenase
VVDQINGSGFGLTLGVHSRIDETIDYITSRAHVGNIYVNRNIVGAVVGVQPFGGEGKSGTGPKAGGPLYLKRLQRDAVSSHTSAVSDRRRSMRSKPGPAPMATTIWPNWQSLWPPDAAGQLTLLPGPTGERNTLALVARGAIACAAAASPCC